MRVCFKLKFLCSDIKRLEVHFYFPSCQGTVNKTAKKKKKENRYVFSYTHICRNLKHFFLEKRNLTMSVRDA